MDKIIKTEEKKAFLLHNFKIPLTKTYRVFLTTLCICFITMQSFAQYTDGPPPGGPPSGPPSGGPPPGGGSNSARDQARNIAQRMIQLEEKALNNQADIIQLQTDELNRLSNTTVTDKDEAGQNARAQFKTLGAKQKQINMQLRSLNNKLRSFPPPDVPRDLAMELRELKNIRDDHGRTIREGFEEIKKLVSSEVGDELPTDEDFDDNDDDEDNEDSEDESVPETEDEAGDIIGGGELKTPKHLLELFERISKDKTPVGNLNYLKNRQME